MWAWVKHLWNRREADLEREIRAHLEWEAEDRKEDGFGREEAERAALRAFGNATLIREECRQMLMHTTFESMIQDLTYACRMLRKNLVFAAASVAILALGIGANTAIFSVVYAALLKPLPYADPDRLFAIHIWSPQFLNRTPSMPARARDFVEWRRSQIPFSAVALFRETALNMTGDGEPERLDAIRVSANLFTLLGVRPELGRNFLADEDAPGRNYVVMLSHQFWVSRFAGDPAIVDRSIQLDGRAYRVAGILPADFVFPAGKQFHPLLPLPLKVDVWTPIALSNPEIARSGDFNYGALGRLKPGVSSEQARQRMDALSEQLRVRFNPNLKVDLLTQLVPIRDVFAGNARGGLVLLLGAAGLLLLIACVNLANLSMARMMSRRTEFATRTALGAGRSRLVRQVLTESALISMLGGVAAVALAKWGTRVIVWLGPADLPMLHQARIHTPVLLFTITVALFTTLMFGLLPALQAHRRNTQEELKAGGRSSTEGARTGQLRRALVTVEVALSTALLAGAGLLLHSFVNVMNVDKGFAVERILSVDLALSPTNYSGDQQRIVFFRDLAQRLAGLPGVRAVGAVTDLPLSNESRTSLIQLESDTQPVLDRPVAASRNVTPGYFSTLMIPLRAGRLFQEQEPVPVAVISQSLAKGLWPDANPSSVIGRGIRQGNPRGTLIKVVGVVGDVQTAALDRQPMPQIYRPYAQGPATQMSLAIRSSSDPANLGRAVRAEIRKMDASLPVPAMKTMSQVVSDSVAERRFQMALIVTFALVALTLTLVGIYGVVSYAVERRSSEIGLRMALGAQRGDVLRSVLLQGLAPVLLGLAFGAAGAALAASALRSFLFGIGPLDPAALGGVLLILLLTAILACYLPARRASLLDPLAALRYE